VRARVGVCVSFQPQVDFHNQTITDGTREATTGVQVRHAHAHTHGPRTHVPVCMLTGSRGSAPAGADGDAAGPAVPQPLRPRGPLGRRHRHIRRHRQLHAQPQSAGACAATRAHERVGVWSRACLRSGLHVRARYERAAACRRVQPNGFALEPSRLSWDGSALLVRPLASPALPRRPQAVPGLYTLTITAPRTLQLLAPVDVNLTVRLCVPCGHSHACTLARLHTCTRGCCGSITQRRAYATRRGDGLTRPPACLCIAFYCIAFYCTVLQVRPCVRGEVTNKAGDQWCVPGA
jgi:hypothetical protein